MKSKRRFRQRSQKAEYFSSSGIISAASLNHFAKLQLLFFSPQKSSIECKLLNSVWPLSAPVGHLLKFNPCLAHYPHLSLCSMAACTWLKNYNHIYTKDSSSPANESWKTTETCRVTYCSKCLAGHLLVALSFKCGHHLLSCRGHGKQETIICVMCNLQWIIILFVSSLYGQT